MKKLCQIPPLLKVTATAILFSFFPSLGLLAQTQQSSAEQILKHFLRDYAGKPDPAFEQQNPTRFSYAFADLKDDGTKEALVYLTGSALCGSGGCVMLVLAPVDGTYKVVTETTVTRLPIRVLETKSNGWHDIGVAVAGGGVRPGYEARLCFNGRSYPRNPSVSPAHPLRGNVSGRIVIAANAMGQLLY